MDRGEDQNFLLLKEGDFARAFRGEDIDSAAAILTGPLVSYDRNKLETHGGFNAVFRTFLTSLDNKPAFYKALFTILKQGGFSQETVDEYMNRKILSNFSRKHAPNMLEEERSKCVSDIQGAFNEVFAPTIH